MKTVPLPEPSHFAPQMITEDACTVAQMRAYGDECVRAALEEAIVECIAKGLDNKPLACADALRRLMP